MTEMQSPEISLRAVDSDDLEDVEDNPEAVLFRIRLSATPSDIWTQEFELAYRVTPYQIKPPVRVAGDALEVIFLPRYAGELPGFVRFLALMARRANAETRRTEEIHLSKTHEQHKAEFRQTLRQLELPQ
ncbi:MAG: hypothetical protein JO250_02110 [Armatimonadetes bacterium]|nr:hypothetical protein [Armatimonadota bacterium]